MQHVISRSTALAASSIWLRRATALSSNCQLTGWGRHTHARTRWTYPCFPTGSADCNAILSRSARIATFTSNPDCRGRSSCAPDCSTAVIRAGHSALSTNWAGMLCNLRFGLLRILDVIPNAECRRAEQANRHADDWHHACSPFSNVPKRLNKPSYSSPCHKPEAKSYQTAAQNGEMLWGKQPRHEH